MTSLHTLTGTILSVINNAILIVGPDDRITFANHKAAAMFRSGDAARFPGLSILEFFMPDDQAILAPNFLQLARIAPEFEEEVMLRRFDGTSFIALISTSQLTLDGGASAILSIHNISSIKGIEKTLKHTERVATLGRMLDDINHQIRNPVSVIGGLAKRLGRQSEADSRYCQAILDEAERLEGLLDTLGAFAKLPHPHARPITIAAIITQINSVLAPKVQTDGFSLTLQCPEPLADATVSVDLDLLIQALTAIVENACEASPAASTIVIGIGPSGKSAHPYRISVTDHGCGISPEDLPRVFAPFYTRKTKRHGMGLTLAQRIILEQGGTISIESTPGGGTTVTISLVTERRRAIRTKRLKKENYDKTAAIARHDA